MSAQGTGKIFTDFNLERFWEQSDYALKEYVGVPLTNEAILRVERALGYKLPPSYVEFMKYRNGGRRKRRGAKHCFPA